ncbi:MAG: cupin domain-containing protein [Bifidobacterium sp.]|uniref:Cupin domain-containing protein n=1 Tax=Bifidobacterium fermentum TaxID=3059035 RepID=A0AB39UCH9_9BIFI
MNDNFQDNVHHGIFPFGTENDSFSQYFIGKSFLASLVDDPKITVSVSNVSFEPGCRNNWHTHNQGFQILLVTGGEGLYQEVGKPARHLRPGDVVVVHDGIRHWHGATSDSWFSHIAITAGTVRWFEPVTTQEYEDANNER